MKLRRLRPIRLVVRLIEFIKQKYLLLISLVLLLLLSLGAHGLYRLLRAHEVNPKDLMGFLGTNSENLESSGSYTNFLVLGIRGEGSDSPNLSDTIIVLAHNNDTQKTTLISLPRDLWIPSLKAKINTAYHYGEEASPGAGIKLAQAAVLESLGLPIHYTAVVNFRLFQQAIDLVGGIDVDVNPGFTDTEFPLPGKETVYPIADRYETISFNQGINHLDGLTALKFVRSRHSEGNEGTDFSRSRRQQQVISALRGKILSPSFLLDKKSLESMFGIVSSNLITNIPARNFPTLARIGLNSKDKEVYSIPLSNLPDSEGVSILYHPPAYRYGGEWVLVPKDNNWAALKTYIQNHLNRINSQP